MKIKTGIYIIGCTLISYTGIAQKIVVEISEHKVKGQARVGLETIIVLDQTIVEKAWQKKLKDYGKLKKSTSGWTIEEANVPLISPTPVTLYADAFTLHNGVKVWLSIDMGDSYISGDHPKYKYAEKIVHDFAYDLYISDINEQISSAEKALSVTVSNQENKLREGNKLTKNLEKNSQEKIMLEEKLQENAVEKITLEQNIEQNKLDKIQVASEVEKLKKEVELVKSKLKDVE
jgi:hypothetical protein